MPYVGPHLSAGKDLIKFQIDNSGDVKVIEFKHIKNTVCSPASGYFNFAIRKTYNKSH
ncbi:DUF3888 domain-containing protein [Paenibacillus sp. SZ31]|nr:DUF3888 domain-containing protein [Paenibacillus sp. SZ31]